MSGRPTEKLDIGALLDEASRANEALRSAAPHTEKAAERPPETPSEAKAGDAPAPDITSELISRYSERVKEPDPRSSTQSLRDSLHAHMEGDRELLAYYSGRSEHRSGKVDELYEIIKSAKSATESDARVRPVPHDASRCQDASEVELPERAEQGKLFPLTETIELGDAAQEQTPSYDEDYAKLSEKIEKGELDFAEETENEGQISIVDELWPDELKAGSTRAIDEELKSVFGMLDEDHYADPDGPDPKQKKREKRPPREEPADAFEYTSREQNAEIGSMRKKAGKESRLRLAGVLFFALATLYLALAAPDSAIHSDFLRPGRYGIVYILVDLQVLLFIAALSLSSIKSGAKALFTWRPTSDSVLFFTFAVSIAYSLLAAFIAPTSESFVPFSLFAAAAAVCAAAFGAAHAAGLTVSCDINYRKNLWKYGKEPQEVLPPLMEQCDAFFGTDDEYEKVLGMQLPQFAARDAAYRPDTAGYERASAEVAARFPRCRSIVFGLRSVLSANHHLISGTLYTGGRLHSTRVYDIDPVVDCVGVGDAFVGGLLYGMAAHPHDAQFALDFGTAACALKNTVPGDYNQFTAAEVEQLARGSVSGRIAR